MFDLPVNDNGLYRWIAVLMVTYLVVSYFARWCKFRKISADHRLVLTRIFDSATFSGSFMLLAGVMDEDLLKLLGSTKPFLLVAGLAGIIYSLHSLAPTE